MSFQNSINSEPESDSASITDDIDFKRENSVKNNKKSEKLNSSINKTFMGSSSIDQNDFDKDSISQGITDDSEIISARSKPDSISFENDFQDDFTDDENNTTSINLISMDQIEKEVDELIKNDYPPLAQTNKNDSQDKPQFRVTFKPEVHEMAYRNYQRIQIQKQQERELLQYEMMYGKYNCEEEEEEANYEPFEDDFLDKDQITPESDNAELGSNEENSIDENEYEKENDSTLAINNDETEEKVEIENDSTLAINNDETEEKVEKERDSKLAINNDETEENKEDQIEKNEETVNLEPVQLENTTNDIATNETEENQAIEQEVENVPFIPPLDLSQFNSSKLISQSQTMNKTNKANPTYHKPKRPVSSCGKIPECIIPTTNKTNAKLHQNKSLSPQAKRSPPKSTPPIKLDQFENQNTSPNDNNNSTKSPVSLLQQVQKKSTESKAEELRNNGFMITFLNSPHIANKQNKQSSPKQQDFTSLLLSTSTNPDSMPAITTTTTTIANSEKNDTENAKEEEEEKADKNESKKFTDEELKKAIDDMLEHRIFPPPEMHVSIQIYIKNNIYKKIIDQDYDEAERLKTAQDMLSNGTTSQETTNERKMIIQSIESRIESTKDKIHELKQQWVIKMEKFEDEIHSKSDELELKQKDEVNKFEETWNSNEILVQFNKPSAQLLEIRKMQKIKALSNDFAGAKELKKRGDQLEKEETRRAERKAMSSMKNAYNQLLSKQQREFEFAKQNWQRQRNLIENEREQEIHSIELTLKQLLNKLNEFKDKNKNSRNSVLSNSPKFSNTANLSHTEKVKKSKVKREVKTPATTTPRTRKQVAKFRTQPRQEKLALNGLNVHQYVKSSKSSSKKNVPHLIREKTEF